VESMEKVTKTPVAAIRELTIHTQNFTRQRKDYEHRQKEEEVKQKIGQSHTEGRK
jgi:hypothetical protein